MRERATLAIPIPGPLVPNYPAGISAAATAKERLIIVIIYARDNMSHGHASSTASRNANLFAVESMGKGSADHSDSAWFIPARSFFSGARV